MKKIVCILCVCWGLLGGTRVLFAIEHYLGVKAELGYMVGTGKNVGTFSDGMQIEFNRAINIITPKWILHRVEDVSVSQGFQLSTQLGLIYQLHFNSWIAVVTELGLGLNNGMTYKGNYSQWVGSSSAGTSRIKAGELARIDKNPLEGDLRYSWTSLDLNLIAKATFARPTPLIALTILAGPAMSWRISEVTTHYTAVSHGVVTPGNSVFDKDNMPTVIAQNPFNIGVTAGVGADFLVGTRGMINLEGRTTWMFRPQLQTYMSDGAFIGVSKPFSISIAYSYRLGR